MSARWIHAAQALELGLGLAGDDLRSEVLPVPAGVKISDDPVRSIAPQQCPGARRCDWRRIRPGFAGAGGRQRRWASLRAESEPVGSFSDDAKRSSRDMGGTLAEGGDADTNQGVSRLTSAEGATKTAAAVGNSSSELLETGGAQSGLSTSSEGLSATSEVKALVR